jgi:hypothetical protein
MKKGLSTIGDRADFRVNENGTFSFMPVGIVQSVIKDQIYFIPRRPFILHPSSFILP